MRHGRAKSARKTLKFYSLNGDIMPPYKVILDGNFLATAVKQKVPIRDRIAKTLQNERYTLYVTRSALDELSRLPGEVFAKARRVGLDECDVIEPGDLPRREGGSANGKEKKDGNGNGIKGERKREEGGGGSLGKAGDDIKSLVTTPLATTPSSASNTAANPRGYFVATQDENLSELLRATPNVPLLRLSRGVLLLESPSSASRGRANRDERSKLMSGGGTMTQEERELLNAVRDEQRHNREEGRRKRDSGASGQGSGKRGKTKAKGPNPLSCKKRKVVDDSGVKKKRQRRRKKGEGSVRCEGGATEG